MVTFEIDFAVLVGIENVDHSLHQRILLQFGQGHEFCEVAEEIRKRKVLIVLIIVKHTIDA